MTTKALQQPQAAKSTYRMKPYEIPIGNKLLFPRVHQFISDPTLFAIFSKIPLRAQNTFVYKGDHHEITRIIREEESKKGLVYCEFKTNIVSA